jgi:diguanylate cyclase (GGDEF)-like protein
MIKELNAFLAGKSLGFILAAGWFLVILVGVVDYITGNGFELDIFYLLPIFVVTWFSNYKAGTATAVFAALVWLLVGKTVPGEVFQTWTMSIWNAFIELGFFLIIVGLLSRLKREMRKLGELARKDALTGIANRRSFYEAAEAEMNRSQRFGSSFSIAYIDIDNFKMVNDTQGHKAGDDLLRLVATTIQQHIRNVDTVARLGGDEFAILFPEAKAEEAKHTPEMIRRLVLELENNNHWPITFSMGVATFSEPPGSVEEMMEFADKLMYSAKTRGKNGVAFESWPVASR